MSAEFDKLVRVLARLRAPDGCPWDREQTHESLRANLLEEAYEVLEALDAKEPARLREELGDLLLQVLFHAQLAEESGAFTLEELLVKLREKLVRRHPHVFGDLRGPEAPGTAEEVLARWEAMKREERNRRGKAGSVLDGVAKTLPALLQALELQERASRVGFDWPEIQPAIEKFKEEWREVEEAWRQGSRSPDASTRARLEEELGDLLFAVVNVARFMQVDPEAALRKAAARFRERFRYIEERAAREGRKLEEMSLEEMDRWWEEAKARERS